MSHAIDSFRRDDRQTSNSAALFNAWVPLAQWLALVTMTVEHACRFLLPDDSAVTPWAITLGRIAFPLFAGMIAWHACHNTRDPMRYGLRILLIALVAQLPYALVEHTLRLNVCFTLACGLFGIAVIQRWEDRSLTYANVLSVTVLWLLVGNAVEYGHLGLLLVPAYWAVFHYRRHPLPLVALLVIVALLNAAPLHALVSLVAAGVLIVVTQVRPWAPLDRLPAMPRRLWLSWYPAHFAVIAGLVVVIEAARPAL
ncbi:TraX family protein [Modicisalibacter radicis]|uniref:TraX family protein n=1 Tax=Halomonas sp. EAR18 TaxID=2518972 RepID=UPI00109D15DB|nr:TraX family protein [Halomonas sp. EAR18]